MIDRTQIAIEARQSIVRQLREKADECADAAEVNRGVGTGYISRLQFAKAAVYTEAADALEQALRDAP